MNCLDWTKCFRAILEGLPFSILQSGSWDDSAVYFESLRRRATVVLEKGGPTMVHSHQGALALAAPIDPEDRRDDPEKGSGAMGADKKREDPYRSRIWIHLETFEALEGRKTISRSEDSLTVSSL